MSFEEGFQKGVTMYHNVEPYGWRYKSIVLDFFVTVVL